MVLSTPERGEDSNEVMSIDSSSSEMFFGDLSACFDGVLTPTVSCCSECCEVHEECRCDVVELGELGLTYNPNFSQEELEDMDCAARADEPMDPDLVSDNEGEEVLRQRERDDANDGGFYMYNGARDVRNQILLNSYAGSSSECESDGGHLCIHGYSMKRCHICHGRVN